MFKTFPIYLGLSEFFPRFFAKLIDMRGGGGSVREIRNPPSNTFNNFSCFIINNWRKQYCKKNLLFKIFSEASFCFVDKHKFLFNVENRVGMLDIRHALLDIAKLSGHFLPDADIWLDWSGTADIRPSPKKKLTLQAQVYIHWQESIRTSERHEATPGDRDNCFVYVGYERSNSTPSGCREQIFSARIASIHG